jgi:farnesyl diphosphate synthase
MRGIASHFPQLLYKKGEIDCLNPNFPLFCQKNPDRAGCFGPYLSAERPVRVTSPSEFLSQLEQFASGFQAALSACLTEKPLPAEIIRPERLMAAMRHGALNGGKRLRPFLLTASYQACGGQSGDPLIAGLALECVHCYSLVHDDLPSMDNDDLRRGQPTVHRAYDEATAILAGDALLTMAFDLLSQEAVHPDPVLRLALIRGLARAAGQGGMVGGQILDLAAEGRFTAGGQPLHLDANAVRQLQMMKTGALLLYAVEAGARLAGATQSQLADLELYARHLGAIFQIADDLLDVEADAATLGKATGKDAEAGKATLVQLLGVEGARAEIARLTSEALQALHHWGAAADLLRAGLYFAGNRSS